MKNKKGFTLIELLVCITILGIIMAMSIPVIRNLTVKNSATKYSSYLDTVVNAAKLYVDSYGDDMFGHYETGCDYVTFEDLKEKNLVKDYNADGITCNTTSTFVEVTKYKDSYSYKGYLGCANKHDTSTLIYTLPNNGTPNEQDPATCAGIDISSTIGIVATPNAYNLLDKNSIDVKIKINGRSGIRRDFNLKYKWSTSGTDFSTTGMQVASFTVPTESTQRIDISAGRMVSAESVSISTPVGESGKMYLIVYSDDLRDLYDNYWVYNDSSYVAFGPYTIDNTPPTFDPSSSIISSDPYYNNNQPKLSISVTDDVTPASNLKMCVSYNDYCTEWEAFDGTKALPTISGFQYNGSEYNVFVSVIDVAGNEARKQFTYRSYVQCSATTPIGNWEGSCPVCGTNAQITQIRQLKDSHLGVSCGQETQPYTCNVSSCCSSKKMECSEWSAYSECTMPCCGGTMTRTRTCRYISNYDDSDCGAVTDSNQLVQTAVCNELACAPYLYHPNIQGLVSYTCNSEAYYFANRECTLYWDRYYSGSLTLSYSVYRMPAYQDVVWKRYAIYNSSTTPYCNWTEECSGFPINGVFGIRGDQPAGKLTGSPTYITSYYYN